MKFKRAPLFASLLLGLASVQAATIEVQADSEFFKDWAFSLVSSPHSPTGNNQPAIVPMSTIGQGSLYGNGFNFGFTADPLGSNIFSVISRTDFFGGWMPTSSARPNNIGLPASPLHYQGFAIDRGVALVQFPGGARLGTTLFLEDVDSNEAIDVAFRDCAGNQVDAGLVDFLQIALTDQPAVSLQGVAPNRTWRLAATVTSTANTINGLKFNTNTICSAQITQTRPSPGGGVNFAFGVPILIQVAAPASSLDTTPTLTGSSNQPGSTVTLTITDAAGVVQTVTTTVQPDGSYQITPATPLAVGPYTVEASLPYPYTRPDPRVLATASGQVLAVPAPVPTLGGWALLLLSLGTLLAGRSRLARRS